MAKLGSIESQILCMLVFEFYKLASAPLLYQAKAVIKNKLHQQLRDKEGPVNGCP